MALITTRMVPGGHLQSVDIKQYADLLLGTMADQPVTINNTLTVNTSVFTPIIGPFAGALALRTSNVNRWNIGSNGYITAYADGVYDIGASGSGRPRSLYLADELKMGGILTIGGGLFGSGVVFTPDNTVDVGAPAASRPRDIYTAGRLYVGTARIQQGDNTHIVAVGSLEPIIGIGASNNLGEAHLKFNNIFLNGGMVSNNWEMIGSNPRLFGPMRWTDPDAQFYMINAWANEGSYVNVRPAGTAVDAGFRAFDKSSNTNNAEMAVLGINATEAFVTADRTGTGVYRPLVLKTGGSNRWQVNTSGHLLASTDNTYDIGLFGASRPRDLNLAGVAYVATNVNTPLVASGGVLTLNSAVQVNIDTAGSTRWYFNSSGHLIPNSNASYDLGGTSNRVRDIWAGGAIRTWGALAVDGGMETYGLNIFNGNIYFQGTGQRILGNFSQGTPANNTIFQTRSSNSQTEVAAMPSGTSKDAVYRVYNNSDPNNASYMQMLASTTDVGFTSDKTGTGVTLPFRFGMAGANAFRIETSGLVDIDKALRLKGNTVPLSGAGLELLYETSISTSVVLSYDRSASAYKDLNINGLNVNIAPVGGQLNVNANAFINSPGYMLGFGGITNAIQMSANALYFDAQGGGWYWRNSAASHATSMSVSSSLGLAIGAGPVGGSVRMSVHADYYGGAYYSVSGQFLTWPSEGAYKTNVQTLDVLGALTNPALRGLSFNVMEPEWSEDPQSKSSRLRWKPPRMDKSYGFRAEDWKPSFPELVVPGPGDVHAFNTMGMVPITWEAVRAVYAELVALRERVAQLESA